MTPKPERPTSLARRAPRPAPDENVDPVDYSPQATTGDEPTPATQRSEKLPPTTHKPAEQPRPKRRPSEKKNHNTVGKREITVPFSTRLTPEVVQLIDQATAETGMSQRAVVENAIRETWG